MNMNTVPNLTGSGEPPDDLASSGEFRNMREQTRWEIAESVHSTLKWGTVILVSLFLGNVAVEFAIFSAISAKLTRIQSSIAALQSSSTSLRIQPSHQTRPVRNSNDHHH